MKNNSFAEIWDVLKKSKRVLMSLHAGPDGDSLGSCAAMKYVLERDLKKEVVLVSPDALPENFNDFAFSKEIQFGKKINDYAHKEGDVFLCLDFGSRAFAEEIGFFSHPVPFVNIDHHYTNEYFGTLNYIVNNDYSTCSILLEIFKKENISFDRELATRLLLGICTDTGFFTYDSSVEKALKDASFLIEHGADYKGILRTVLYNTPLKIRKIEGTMFGHLEYDRRFNVGYSWVSHAEMRKLDASVADVKIAIHSLQFVKEFDFIFTLTEIDGVVKGSFRTNKKVNVARFAEALGGGGHIYAAGFALKSVTLEEAKKNVLEVIERLGIEKAHT